MSAQDPKEFLNQFVKRGAVGKGAGIGAGLMAAAVASAYGIYQSMFTGLLLNDSFYL